MLANYLDRAHQLDSELASSKPEDQEVQDDLSLARAEYALATGNAKRALELLKPENYFDQKTYLGLNRRLTYGRALRAAGDRGKATAELSAVHRDAMKAGYKLLASKALAH